MKRIALILLTPLLGLALLILIVDGFVMPRVGDWLGREIKAWSQREFPLELSAEKIQIRLFPPTVEVHGLLATPVKEWPGVPEALRLNKASLDFDLFDLFLGRLEVAGIQLEGLDVKLELDPLMKSDSPAKDLPLEQIFSWAGKIPIRRVTLSEVRLQANSQRENLRIQLESGLLSLLNRGKSLDLVAKLPRLEAQWKSFPALELSLETRARLEKNLLRIEDLSLRYEDLILSLRGESSDPARLPTSPRLRLNAELEAPLLRIGERLQKFKTDLKLPNLQGDLKVQTEVRLEGLSDFKSLLKLDTRHVKIGAFDIGDATLQGTLTPTSLALEKILLKHNAGRVQISQAQVEFKAPFALKADIETPELDMQKLFRALDLNEIPVESRITGRFTCEGQGQSLDVTCRGQATSPGLHVRAENDNSAATIVHIKDLEAEGKARLTLEAVEFESALRIGQSRGQTKGKVSFKEGFRIDFKGPDLRFADVENLANLDFEGRVSLEGFTSGDSQSAIFDIQASTQDFVFENYNLGRLESLLRYRQGHLFFEEARLQKGQTLAEGMMDLDLVKDRLSGNLNISRTDLSDVASIFERIWKAPFELQGPGSGKVTFDGGFDFWSLNVDLQANFRQGRIQGDGFDELQLHVTNEGEGFHFQKALLSKNTSRLELKGRISKKQEMDLLLDATGWRLEESELIGRVKSNLSGQLTFATEIKGLVTEPEFKIRGSLSDIIVDETEIPSSFFQLRLTKDLLEGETNLFGNKIQGDLLIPFQAGRGPLRVRVKTTDWNFASLLALAGGSSLQNEYDSSLSSEVDLQSNEGRWDLVNGRILIRQAHLKRGQFSLRNPAPAEAVLDRGRITLKNVTFEGPQGASIRLRGENFRLDQLNVVTQADSDLRLLHLFVPFLEDLGGSFKVSATLGGRLFKPQLLGSATLTDAFVKIKGFPHPLEKIRSEIVFSQSRILVQNLKGQLAGGQFSGDGSIVINELGDVPVNIRARAENLSLNVPDKVRSNGSADLVFSGRWFPYTLSGTYTTTSALVEKEFGDDEAASLAQRGAEYLPQILRQATFDPVVLDLQVQLPKNIQIRNSLMEGQVTGTLQVKGPPDNPILLGKITTEKNSKIIFKDKPFELQTGTLTFNNPNEVNPDLYLSAQSRINEFDINVLVQGPAKTPNIRMTSVPPLGEQDIISLLALGITSTRLESQVQSKDQAAQIGYEALGLGLQRTGLKKGLESTLGVNVQLSSNYDGTKNISVPKITFTKQLGPKVNASVSRTLGTEQTTNEVKLQYQIDNNYSAIGSFEDRQAQEGASIQQGTGDRNSIFGLDLEFKREFK